MDLLAWKTTTERMMHLANRQAYKNGLRSQFQSGDEAVKAGRAGGVASGRSKRKWASLREAFKDRMTDGDRLRIFDAMLEKAAAGEIRAAEFIRDTMGEKPTDRIEQTVNEIAFRVEGVSPKEADEIFG